MSQESVLNILKKSKKHLNSKEIQSKLKLGSSTVCKNLLSLYNQGIIKRTKDTSKTGRVVGLYYLYYFI